ncbi:MAG: molybdopterin-binding protein [Paracoccaceae bacterium]
MPNPTAAILVIGDEILSGRTQDTNTQHLATELTAFGIDLKEVRVVSDDQAIIVSALNTLRQNYDNVFTSGGIGPTHDDITADAVAATFGVGIDIRDDARKILEARYAKTGSHANPARLRMARIPDSATLIDNPVSGAPGFSVENVHVMAGVPAVFRAMVASVLPQLTGGTPLISQSLRINRGESHIAGPLAGLAESFPELLIGSYPFQHQGVFGADIILRGTDESMIAVALADLAARFPGHTQ